LKATERFYDKLCELGVDGLVGNHWVGVHSGFNVRA